MRRDAGQEIWIVFILTFGISANPSSFGSRALTWILVSQASRDAWQYILHMVEHESQIHPDDDVQEKQRKGMILFLQKNKYIIICSRNTLVPIKFPER